MNDLQIFNNEEFGEVRTAVVNDEPMFCLIDICKALEIKNATDVAKRLDEDERTRLNLGRQGETNFITESGLYAVILRSDKPNAKKFRKWVTSEVLPSIRKTGGYEIPKSTSGQIQLLAQGYTELEEAVNSTKEDVTELKDSVPLYGCEIEEVSKHVKRKAVKFLAAKKAKHTGMQVSEASCFPIFTPRSRGNTVLYHPIRASRESISQMCMSSLIVTSLLWSWASRSRMRIIRSACRQFKANKIE